MKKFGLILMLSSFLAVGLTGCGQAPSKPTGAGITTGNGNKPGISTDADGDGIDDKTGAPVVNVPMDISLASFKANLYEPLLVPYCQECHSSTFGNTDMEAAHLAFLERAKLDNFVGIQKSFAVAKMATAHSCWEGTTKACVDAMASKMDLWLKDLESGGFKPTPVSYPNATGDILLTTAKVVPLAIPPQYAFSGSTGAGLAGGYAVAIDDVDGAIQNYATAPALAARAAAAPNAANPGAIPVITYTLDAKTAGTYFVWARVKTPAETANEMWVSPAGANFASFIAPVTGADTWKWAQMFIAAANAVVPTANPFTFNVAAPGPVQLRVANREGSFKINQLVITTSPDFNGDLFVKTYMDITVPLKVPGVEGASIVATVWENTVEEGKRSLGVKELRIVSPVALKIKGIRPLINGLYNDNHGTYTIVDAVAGGPTAPAVITTGGATASTWLADIKTDKISFSFDEIKVAAP